MGYEAGRKGDYEAAKAAREAKQAECIHKANYYASENARRNSEIEAVDECLTIFADDLGSTSDYTESRAEHGTDFDAPDRRIYDYGLDRTDYQEAGGYKAGEL